MASVDGQVIVVTGASSGLGEQVGRAIARAGGVPVLAARRKERLDALREDIPGADAVVCDVTDEDDRPCLVETAVARAARLAGLVTNAGAGGTAPALRTPTETFSRVVAPSLLA